MWLEAIWRYPVKSMRGEQLVSAHLGEFGVPGDRLAYVADWRGATVSARTKARLLQLTGGLARDGSATVGGHPWNSEPAARLVREAAGTDAHVVQAESFERFDILPLLVVTDGAVREAGLDLRRLRPNLVISGVEGLAERDWQGRFLRIGQAVVHLVNLRERCIVPTYEPDTGTQDVGVLMKIRREFGGVLGLNAWTAGAGLVEVGDAVELLESFEPQGRPGLGRFVGVGESG